MSALPVPRFTFEQYLAMEQQAERKSEFIDGQIVAMAGGTPRHSIISANLAGLFYGALRGKSCRTLSSDMLVKAGASSFYPDLSICCGDLQFSDTSPTLLLNPSLICEVLSPSTEAIDRGFKFHQYKTIPSLEEYVLVSQTEPMVEIFRRTGDPKQWLVAEYQGLTMSARLESIDTTIQLADIYGSLDSPLFGF